MPKTVKIDVSESDIETAIKHARLLERCDRCVKQAVYSQGTDSIVLHLNDGVVHSIPRRLLQGLAGADAGSLKNIEVMGRGSGLYWPALDVAHSVSGLLAGIFGSAKWMKQIERQSEQRQISA